MNIREKRERLEDIMVCGRGVRSKDSRGRAHFEEKCAVRTEFQRDVDRITYSKSFRRLKHKTQVFLRPEGDHYRTRLTHTLEVTRIARTIARALELNEDLTEAIGLGHDLGHTPFGHAGERALNELLSDEGGFRHYEQSLKVVDTIEKEGRGLNLTYEVRNGIVRHTNGEPAETLEGQIVRLADRIAYVNHDMDDAIRAGIIKETDIPAEITGALGTGYSERINTLVQDVIEASADGDEIKQSPHMFFILDTFHNYMYEQVYKNPEAKSEETKVFGMLEGIYNYYIKRPKLMPEEYRALIENDGEKRAVCDYISGMTDRYAVDVFSEIYIPMAWSVV